jgi:hypothetical protein
VGADLYLNSVFPKNQARHKPKFNYWVAKRDASQKAAKLEAADKAQQQVWKYYNRMCEHGYFRDSYNSSNLLWLFDLSWWQDVAGVLTDKGGKMNLSKVRRFLQMLEDREPLFDANLKKVKLAEGETRQDAEKYFRDKYKRLKAFLQEAIDRKERIECSL